ncbi:MAG TPA: hypothetical protein VL092_03600 [Chitinophagaceae bacterium]|nr:hypothetical protein [Chitinophagaceae bacterium]
MGHNAPPPACAVTDFTFNYGALLGITSTVNAPTAAWKGPGASWISRIKMFNVRTGGDYDQPFCTGALGTYTVTFSDGTPYTITLTAVGGTVQVALNP